MKATRIFAFGVALMLAAVPLTGCGFAKEYDGSTLEMNMDNSWRSEKALQNVSHVPVFSVGTRLLCAKSFPDQSVEYLWYDVKTGETVRFDRTNLKYYKNLDPLERAGGNAMLLPDGNIGIYCNVYQNLGGGESETHRQFMEIYDTDMNYIETREIPVDFGEHPDFDGSYRVMDGKGNWYVFYGDIYSGGSSLLEVYNSNFEKYGDIDFPGNSVYSPVMFTGADGTMYGAFEFMDSQNRIYQKVYRLDAENHTCEETRVTVPQLCNAYKPGTNGYDYYYITNDGLYGVREDEVTEVIDWINSDFMPGDIEDYFPIEDGTFVLRDSSRRYWYATPRTQEEIDSTNIISLASVVYSEDLLDAVIDYNREGSGNRIMIVDYSEYNTLENPNIGYEVMKQDMLNGIVADIICPDGVNFESLASKGLFADWYDFMDNDPEFSRDNYLQNYFEAMEYNGKLQRLGFSYVIETGTAKTEFAGDTQGMSLGEQLTLAKKLGIDAFHYSPAERLAETWLGNLQTGCIDRKTATCYFDSPEFVQFLELLNSIPQGDQFYQAAENGEYYTYAGNPYHDGVIFLNTEPIAQPIKFRAIRRHTFFDSDITLVGLPMVHDEGNGGAFNTPFTVCINAQSTEQAAIWDFMKFFLTEDYQKHLTESMPIHKDALEYKFEEAEGMVTANIGNRVFIGELEEWESNILRDYIQGIRTSWYYDQKIHDILMEEADKMLAGDQTPQECAEMMQSRVSIYLSEQT